MIGKVRADLPVKPTGKAHPLFSFLCRVCLLPPLAGAAAVGKALVAYDAPRDAHQDRGQGRHALAVRDLPDGGSGRAQATVPSDFGADTPVATARDGAEASKVLGIEGGRDMLTRKAQRGRGQEPI